MKSLLDDGIVEKADTIVGGGWQEARMPAHKYPK